MNDKQTSWTNARQRFSDEWGVMSFYERFEQVVALILTNVIAVVIVISLFQLIRALVVLLAGEAFNLLDHAVFQNLFGMIMTLLIALSRKFVILDTATTDATKIAALAGALLALGGVYWLLRESDDWPVGRAAKREPIETSLATEEKNDHEP